MLIRNLLVVVPFIAVYIGLGVEWLWHRSDNRWLRVGLMASLVIMLNVNATWLIYTAQTITQRRTDTYLDNLSVWVEQSPDVTFYASSRVLENLGDNRPSNITGDLSNADEVLVYLKAIQEVDPMPANIPRLFTWQFGSWEVNIEYYTWHGDDKIVLLPIEVVYTLGLESYLD